MPHLCPEIPELCPHTPAFCLNLQVFGNGIESAIHEHTVDQCHPGQASAGEIKLGVGCGTGELPDYFALTVAGDFARELVELSCGRVIRLAA
jgi:hypothetical protein